MRHSVFKTPDLLVQSQTHISDAEPWQVLRERATAARRARELAEEEEERKRRDAAAAKLRALEERIKAREAEMYVV